MHHNMLMLSRIAIATVAFAAAGSASAVDLYGGGATFPAPAYVGDLYNSLSPKARLSRPAGVLPAVSYNVAALGNSSGTLVPVFAKYGTLSSNRVSYCQTGSGTGKNVFNQNGIAANGNCFDNGTAAVTGFTSTDPTPDFIGTDSPISTADYTTFNTNMSATRTAIVQIPTLAGAIAIPFNDNAAGGPTTLNLSTEQVCQIFAGNITSWTDSRLGLGLTGTHPIRVVYRGEGSGTSFAFTSYLAAQCNGKFTGIPAGYFAPNQSFATAAATALPKYYQETNVSDPSKNAPSAQTGNNNVVARVNLSDDAISYADVAEVISQGAMYALVGGFDPVSMPASLSILPASVLQGQVLNGSATAAAPGTATAAQKNCLKLISPSAPISGAYPIVAVTYINAYWGGNAAAKVAPVKDLLKLFYDPTNAPVLPAGYSYLSGNALMRSQMTTAINGCVN